MQLSKPIGCTASTVNSDVNYGLSVIMMYKVSSWTVTIIALWWGMSIVGEVVSMWRQGLFGNAVYFWLNSAVNLKLV